jgi:hypothetical protein
LFLTLEMTSFSAWATLGTYHPQARQVAKYVLGDFWPIAAPLLALLSIANLRYPAKNDKFFAGERRYSY